VIGVILNNFPKFHLPQMPGDILIQEDSLTFYFPVIISLIVSILLILILNLFK